MWSCFTAVGHNIFCTPRNASDVLMIDADPLATHKLVGEAIQDPGLAKLQRGVLELDHLGAQAL